MPNNIPPKGLLLDYGGTLVEEVRSDARAGNEALLARALLEQGEASRARGELQAARAAFETLGARLELARLEDLLERDGDS